VRLGWMGKDLVCLQLKGLVSWNAISKKETRKESLLLLGENDDPNTHH
jgi:hypothetical protein